MNDSPITVVLLTTHPADQYVGLRERLAGRGVDAQILCATTGPCGLPVPSSRWRQILRGRRLARAHQDRIPALIHAFGRESADLALELASRWKRPYLLAIDEFLRPGEGVRLARRWCRGLITTGREPADDLIREMGVPSRFVMIVPPGVATGSSRRDAPAGPWLPVVGTAVGADYGSGLPIFLDAARQVLDSGVEAEFVLAEAGSGSAFARRLAGGIGMADRLTIVEGIDLESAFWPVLDVYAHTSRLPSTGRPLLAAMAHGIPAIASDVSGLREIADGGTAARLIEPGDPGALAASILELLADRPLASDLARRGMSRIVDAYSPDREADALAAIYRAAIASRDGVGVRLRADSASVAASRRS